MTNLEKYLNGLQTIFEQGLSFYDLRVYDGNFSKSALDRCKKNIFLLKQNLPVCFQFRSYVETDSNRTR